MTVFVALAPLRRGNLVDLRIGYDLLLQDPMVLTLDGHGEKTDSGDWRDLPDEIAKTDAGVSRARKGAA